MSDDANLFSIWNNIIFTFQSIDQLSILHVSLVQLYTLQKVMFVEQSVWLIEFVCVWVCCVGEKTIDSWTNELQWLHKSDNYIKNSAFNCIVLFEASSRIIEFREQNNQINAKESNNQLYSTQFLSIEFFKVKTYIQLLT